MNDVYDPLLFIRRGRIEAVTRRGQEPDFRVVQIPGVARPDDLLPAHASLPLAVLRPGSRRERFFQQGDLPGMIDVVSHDAVEQKAG